VQRLSIEDLGDDVRGSALDADVVHREYVRMIQPTRSSRFLLESAPPIRIAGKRRRQDFDRDVALQLMVACPIHLAHAPSAQRAQYFEAAKAIAHRESHRASRL
jgi:hypothetical protein